MVCVGCRSAVFGVAQDFENSPRAVGSFLGSSRVPTPLARICNMFNEVFLAAHEEINVFACQEGLRVNVRPPRLHKIRKFIQLFQFPTRLVLRSPGCFMCRVGNTV